MSKLQSEKALGRKIFQRRTARNFHVRCGTKAHYICATQIAYILQRDCEISNATHHPPPATCRGSTLQTVASSDIRCREQIRSIHRMRVLEFFSGIGGCAAALSTVADAVLAFDIDQAAVATYRHNYPNHQCEARAIESLASTRLGQFAADLWWMSPPCQPFTKQGKQRDENDARTSPFLCLIDQVCHWLPRYVALENVPGFATSKTRQRLLSVLKQCGYTIREFDACPTQLGWPMRRQRYYLVASRGDTLRLPAIQSAKRGWSDFWNLHPAAGRQFVFPEDVLLQKYCSHLHLMRWDASDAIARCFTSAYGRSPLRSGSYVEEHDGRIRHFAPEELLRLMGFPDGYQFPEGVSTRTAWSLIGNSLAVPVVRYVLSTIPELAPKLAAGDGDGRCGEGGIY